MDTLAHTAMTAVRRHPLGSRPWDTHMPSATHTSRRSHCRRIRTRPRGLLRARSCPHVRAKEQGSLGRGSRAPLRLPRPSIRRWSIRTGNASEDRARGSARGRGGMRVCRRRRSICITSANGTATINCKEVARRRQAARPRGLAHHHTRTSATPTSTVPHRPAGLQHRMQAAHALARRRSVASHTLRGLTHLSTCYRPHKAILLTDPRPCTSRHHHQERVDGLALRLRRCPCHHPRARRSSTATTGRRRRPPQWPQQGALDAADLTNFRYVTFSVWKFWQV